MANWLSSWSDWVGEKCGELAPDGAGRSLSWIAECIYSFLVKLTPDIFLLCVIAALVVLFVLGRSTRRFRQSAFSLMLSVGVLGTVCGLFLVLYPALKCVAADISVLLHGVIIGLVSTILSLVFAIAYCLTDPMYFATDPENGRRPKSSPDQSAVLAKLSDLLRESEQAHKKLDVISSAAKNVARADDLANAAVESRDLVARWISEEISPLLRDIKDGQDRAGESQATDVNEEVLRRLREIKDGLDRADKSQATDANEEVLRRLGEIQTATGKRVELFDLVKEVLLTIVKDMQAGISTGGDAAFRIIGELVGKLGEGLSAYANAMASAEEHEERLHVIQDLKDTLVVVKALLGKLGEDFSTSAEAMPPKQLDDESSVEGEDED